MCRKLSYFLFLNLFSFIPLSAILNAQYSNDWIEELGYNKTYFKFKTTHTGLTRIYQPLLLQNGIDLNGANYRIFNGGEEIPIYVSSNGLMQEEDYIEFFVEELSGYFDTQLYAESSDQLNANISLFDRKNTYYLVIDDENSGLRFTDTENYLEDMPIAEQYFWQSNTIDFPFIYHSGEFNFQIGGIGLSTPYFERGEGFASNQIGGVYSDEFDFEMSTTNIFKENSSFSAFVTMRVVGKKDNPYILDGDKDFDIFVNDSLYVHAFASDPNVNSELLIDDLEFKDYNFNISLSDLVDVNEFKLKVYDEYINEISSLSDHLGTQVAVVYATINYPKNFNANNSRNFSFTTNVDEAKLFEITDFNGGIAPVVYDLSSNQRIIPVEQEGIYKFILKESSEVERKIILNSTSYLNIESISELNQVHFKDLSQVDFQGDYILIYNNELKSNNCEQDPVQRYIDYRASEAGGNYKVVAYNVESLYDQFAHGIEQHPMAIKSFINYAKNNWEVQPQMLNLVGKAVEYRYRDSQDIQENLVPSYGNSASDLLLVSSSTQDFEPLLAFGRVPVQDCETLNNYIDKLESYEQNYLTCNTEQLAWMENEIYISAIQSQELELDLNELNDDNIILVTDTTEASYNLVQDQLENGLYLIHYLGHSSYQGWAFDLGDPDNYINEGKYPFVLSNTQHTGNIFRLDANSMSEKWVLADKAGAIAYLGSRTYESPSINNLIAQSLLEKLKIEGNEELPIAIALQETILEISEQIEDYEYPEYLEQSILQKSFCGDPAIRLYNVPYYIQNCINSNIQPQKSNNIQNASISPNPVKNTLHIKGSIDNLAFVDYQIWNLEGRKITENTLLDNNINVTKLNSGIYLLVLTDKNGMTYTSKFMKE